MQLYNHPLSNKKRPIEKIRRFAIHDTR
jgi:hypothetical protein